MNSFSISSNPAKFPQAGMFTTDETSGDEIMVDDKGEYISDPTLAVLARDLAALNEQLLALKIPGRFRLLRLRLYANDVLGYTRLPDAVPIELIQDGTFTNTGKYRPAPVRGKELGAFDTPQAAARAYREAHAETFGAASEYHTDFVPHKMNKTAIPSDEQFAKDGKPIKIKSNDADSITPSSSEIPGERLPRGVYPRGERFVASIAANGITRHLGIFDSVEQAHETFKRAHVEYHGSKSKYFAEMQNNDADRITPSPSENPGQGVAPLLATNNGTLSGAGHQLTNIDDDSDEFATLDDLMFELIGASMGAGLECSNAFNNAERIAPLNFPQT